MERTQHWKCSLDFDTNWYHTKNFLDIHKRIYWLGRLCTSSMIFVRRSTNIPVSRSKVSLHGGTLHWNCATILLRKFSPIYYYALDQKHKCQSNTKPFKTKKTKTRMCSSVKVTKVLVTIDHFSVLWKHFWKFSEKEKLMSAMPAEYAKCLNGFY